MNLVSREILIYIFTIFFEENRLIISKRRELCEIVIKKCDFEPERIKREKLNSKSRNIYYLY